MRAHQHSEKVNRKNPIPKRRAIEDTVEAGPAVQDPRSTRHPHELMNFRQDIRLPVTSLRSSYSPRAQFAHEKCNHMNFNIKATISIQMSRA